MRLRVRTAGDGPAVLFLHGWALDLDMWRAQFEALASRYRLIAFDRRGFGLSSGTPSHRGGHRRYRADAGGRWTSSALRSSACRRAPASRCAWALRFPRQNGLPRSRRTAARIAGTRGRRGRRKRFRSRTIASSFCARAWMRFADNGWSIRSCACTRTMRARMRCCEKSSAAIRDTTCRRTKRRIHRPSATCASSTCRRSSSTASEIQASAALPGWSWPRAAERAPYRHRGRRASVESRQPGAYNELLEEFFGRQLASAPTTIESSSTVECATCRVR